MNILIAVSVDWAMTHPHTAIGRYLNSPAVRFVGVLSYSLYLWQQLFLDRTSARIYCAFPLNVILVAIVALISYYVVEVPFLRWRDALPLLRRAPLTSTQMATASR